MARLTKKFCLLGLIFSFLLSFIPQTTLAVNEADCRRYESEENWDEAEGCWHDYFGTKKRTLQNEIASKTVQIELTAQKIISAQGTISQLEEEIEKLGGKISDLDISLNQLSEVLIKRIAETYKKGQLDTLALFLSSQDFSDFVARYKYLQVIQLHDRKLLLQMETARTNYEDQRTLKEEKQDQLANWKRKLEIEKIQLAQAAEAKKILLGETEASYQQALARIAAQREQLSGVSIFGKPAEFKQWPEDNDYFNQTDIRWAMMLIGGGVYSQSYMWEYGCAVTSMAMVLRNSGVGIDPGTLSQKPIYRADLMAWQDVPGQFGGSIQVIGHGYGDYYGPLNSGHWATIDEHLNAGRRVIVYISGVGHYVVLWRKNGDGGYQMHDPYFGPDLSFNSKYSQAAVDEMVVYTR